MTNLFANYCSLERKKRASKPPKISKTGRMYRANWGKNNELFEIVPSIGRDGTKRLKVTWIGKYLPTRFRDKRFYYKSGTVKMGGFFDIVDICRHWFGEDDGSRQNPEWEHVLKLLYEDSEKMVAEYQVLE